MKKAYGVVEVRGKNAPDTSERWFGVASVEFSVVGESSSQQSVQISNINSRRVSWSDGGWRPYVIRWAIASRVKPRAEKGLQP